MDFSRNFFFNFIKLSVVFLFVFSSIKEVYASLKINLVVVNAAEDKGKDYPIKYYLPKELKPTDILEPGGLSLDYDIDKQSYYVGGTIHLGPKESKTIKIEVKDVWKVSKDEVESLKQQIDGNLVRIQKTPYYERGKALKNFFVQQLDTIMTEQENFSGNIERRIESYRSHVTELKSMKSKIFSVEYWEGKMTKLEPVPTVSQDKGKTVKMVLEVENPEENGTKPVKHQHYLPPEIKPEDIVDPKGFDIRYDADKKQYYLIQEEEFQPGQKKRYEIQMKDVWNISEESQKFLKDQAQETFKEIEKSPYGKNYVENAKNLFKSIEEGVQEITESQNEQKTVKEHIGIYRINQKRMEQIQEDIKKLVRVLDVVNQKRLEELETTRIRNVLQKVRSLKGISEIAKQVFGGKPTVTETWKMIWMTVVFLAVFTTIHFVTWWFRSRGPKTVGLKEIERKVEETKQKIPNLKLNK